VLRVAGRTREARTFQGASPLAEMGAVVCTARLGAPGAPTDAARAAPPCSRAAVPIGERTLRPPGGVAWGGADRPTV
jgi:hypothetical protein